MFSALKKFLGGAEKKEILAPVSGKVIPMSQVILHSARRFWEKV